MERQGKIYESGTDRTSNTTSEDFIAILETVKQQYHQYLEVSELYKLPHQQHEEPMQPHPPSPEQPLTTNSVQVK